MCTAATYQTTDFYFGRTLDYDFSYQEEVTITPRNFPFSFTEMGCLSTHYAMIGMAYVQKDYPLYYDAMNEKGLCMAGLNFVGNAYYGKTREKCDNIAQFELIPWILSQCATVRQARELLKRINLTDTPFSPQLPAAQLHWLIADKAECITLEATLEGIHIYDNPVGVLTNNPPFHMQIHNLNNYMHLSPRPPENRFAQKVSLTEYSRGMGALGLPGDLSSQSRFVRAAFTKLNSASGKSEQESVNQFFHILGTVQQTRGCCEIKNGDYEITVYTSCCNADKGIYYYTTYDNQWITGVDLHREDLDGRELSRYPLVKEDSFFIQNKKR